MSTAIEGRLIRLEIIARQLVDQQRAIMADLLALKRDQRSAQLGGYNQGGGGGNPVRRGVVTTPIPGGSFAAPSTLGKVQLYKLSLGVWVADGDPVAVQNQFGGLDAYGVPLVPPIGEGGAVFVAQIEGIWFVIAADCPPYDEWEAEDPPPEEPGGGGDPEPTDPEDPGGTGLGD